jgi:hypothetical protein
MKRLLLSSAATLAIVIGACGGNVVVDPAVHTTGNGASGVGGTTASLVTGPMGGAPGTGASVGVPASTGGGASPPGCLVPTPGNVLMQCGGSGATTTGGPIVCVFQYCESNSPNTYQAQCQGTTCDCSMNGAEICTCGVVGASDICALGHDCCVAP